jgi:hypothetical protein
VLVGWLNAVGICVVSSLLEVAVVVAAEFSVLFDSAALLVNVLAVMLDT